VSFCPQEQDAVIATLLPTEFLHVAEKPVRN
jgi:hypothetical protein